MADEVSKSCVECQGTMCPVVLMDKVHHSGAQRELEYRLPEARPSFWRGLYPPAGRVRAFLCGGCGRISLYGSDTEPEPGAAIE